jgi:hypothetical protein
MKPETRFKERIRPKLDAIPNSYWIKTQMRSLRGVPDFFGCVSGRCVVIELKTDKGKTDPLQDYVLERFRKAGGLHFVMAPANAEKVLQELYSICKTG